MTTLAPAGTNDYVLTSQGAAAPQWKDVTTLVPAAVNYWQLANHVVAPANAADYDLAVGGNSTTSAKFQVLAANGNLVSSGNASISGSLTFRSGAGSIGTTTMSDLTLGSATTGNVILNSRGSTALTANGTAVTFGGTTGLGGRTYTWPGTETAGFLITNGSGGLSWTTSLPSGTTIGFDKITTGTNTSQTLTVGNGSSLTYTGTGTINATTLTGNTWASPGAIGSTTPNTGAFTTLTSTGVTTLGNNTNTVAINSNDWDIDTTGAMSGIGAISMNGAITGATGFNGLVVTPNTGVITTGTWNGTAIGATYGGTGQTSYAVGDLLYANSTTTLNKLADVATGNVLISGGVNTAPSWGKVVLGTHTTGNYVSTITGTANQITASATTGDVTLSIPSDFRAPGTVNATNGIYTGATAGTQRIDASGNLINIGNISASGYATVSGSLALGNTTAAVGPGHINMSGNLVVGGTTGLGGRTYTWPGTETSGAFLTTNGSGALSWTTTVPATSIPFSGITSGTNTVAAMVVGTGASLNYTGTGTINASSLIGNTWAAPGAIGNPTPAAGKFTTI
jgi:hypothetical protein